ncbi:hypothetical protein Pmani_015258 [Petrolisthes manimaculis]|uniref:Uncharacterized protein n=1 Tax=Petrolisthes manimaculis TaxID=1843537 RepID=A0AAE1PRA0_9EUCA|nr:hypothetical protein Pmani_015258 [Petrolisthes manimaculis]
MRARQRRVGRSPIKAPSLCPKTPLSPRQVCQTLYVFQTFQAQQLLQGVFRAKLRSCLEEDDRQGLGRVTGKRVIPTRPGSEAVIREIYSTEEAVGEEEHVVSSVTSHVVNFGAEEVKVL